MPKPKLTQEVMDIILFELAGGASLRAICRRHDVPVSETAVRKKALNDPTFGSQYAREGYGHRCHGR